MSKDYEFVGRDVLLAKRSNTHNPDTAIGIRLSSVTRWEPNGLHGDRTHLWFNDGGERIILVRFDEFTKIIGMPLATSLED